MSQSAWWSLVIGIQLEAIDHGSINQTTGDRLNEICDEMDDVIRTVRSTVFELPPSADEQATA